MLGAACSCCVCQSQHVSHALAAPATSWPERPRRLAERDGGVPLERWRAQSCCIRAPRLCLGLILDYQSEWWRAGHVCASVRLVQRLLPCCLHRMHWRTVPTIALATAGALVAQNCCASVMRDGEVGTAPAICARRARLGLTRPQQTTRPMLRPSAPTEATAIMPRVSAAARSATRDGHASAVSLSHIFATCSNASPGCVSGLRGSLVRSGRGCLFVTSATALSVATSP